MALCSPMERLEVGALAWERMPTTRKRAASATSSGSLRRPFSTAATISLYGTRLGVGAKLRPFSSTDSSSGCNCLLERFTTLRSEEPPARFPLVRFRNLCLSLHLHYNFPAIPRPFSPPFFPAVFMCLYLSLPSGVLFYALMMVAV